MGLGIGSFIWNRIEEKKIKKKELCKGLCSPSELSKVFVGEKILNYFLMERILDRLGISTEKFEYILPQRDYELCRLRYEIEERLRDKYYEEIEELLCSYEKKGKGYSCHQQYVFYVRAMVEFYIGDKREAVLLLQKSIEYTIPDGFYEGVILGAEEIKLLILFEQLQYEFGEKTKKAKKKYYQFLEQMKQYVDDKIEDEEIKASIYPRITIDIIKFYMERQQYNSARKVCQESIDLLTKNFILYGLLEYIKLLREIYQHIQVDIKEKYRLDQIHKALCFLYEEGEQKKEENYLIGNTVRQISLDWEVIKGIRHTYQMSQQKLADDMYARESISRIESGKRKVNYKKLKEIKQRFGIDSEVYDSVLRTVDFRALELERQMKLWWKRMEWGKVRELLEKIKTCSLEDSVINKQFFEYHMGVVQYSQKEIDEEEFKERLKHALYLTKPKKFDLVNSYLTSQEVYIINSISVIMYEMGKKREALDLRIELLSHYDESKVDSIFYYHNIILILSNLAKAMEELGNIEQVEVFYERAIQLSKKVGRGDRIGRFFNLKGWILEHYRGEKEKAYFYYEQAFWILNLLNQCELSEIIRRYYKENIGIDLWNAHQENYQKKEK